MPMTYHFDGERGFLSRAQMDDLPDSSFALVIPGRKDADGKTIPRGLRLLPFKDSSGTLIEPEARNAFSALNQMRRTDVPTAAKVAAWKRVVVAFEAWYESREFDWKFVPPPRKF